jgi:hypothetical protein
MKSRIAVLVFFSIICTSWNLVAGQPATAPAAPDREDAALRAQLEQMRYQFPLRVVGTVTDAESGRPIERFIVMPVMAIHRDGMQLDYRSAAEFSGGSYEYVNERPRHDLQLRIEADGYLPVTSPPLSEHVVATFDAKLKPAPNITGQILTADGKPVAGADVMLITSQIWIETDRPHQPGWQTYPIAKTDDEGRFTHRPTDEKYLLAAVHDAGHATARGADHDANSPLRLDPWARIEGTFRVGDRPAARQLLLIDPQERSVQQSRDEPWVGFATRTSTDESGKFTCARVPAGKGKIIQSVSQPGPGGESMPGRGIIRTYDVRPGESITIDLGGRGRPVVGKIKLPGEVDADSFIHGGLVPSEVARGDRRVSPRAFTVDASGAFRIDDVEPGTYRIDISLFGQPNDPPRGDFTPAAMWTTTFTIDPIPGGRSDEALNLGELEAEMLKR